MGLFKQMRRSPDENGKDVSKLSFWLVSTEQSSDELVQNLRLDTSRFRTLRLWRIAGMTVRIKNNLIKINSVKTKDIKNE